MSSEITKDEDHENPYFSQDKESEKKKIRQIIDYQKSLFFSSSSSSSSSSTAASTTCSSKSSSLLELMREGSTSLRRLFDMEHTSLANYFNDYSVSPIVKPILLWGSDADNDEVRDDPWAEIRVGSSRRCCNDEEFKQRREMERTRKRKLVRTKSYKRLPGFSLWRCGKFRFKLRLIRKIRVLVRGRIF